MFEFEDIVSGLSDIENSLFIMNNDTEDLAIQIINVWQGEAADCYASNSLYLKDYMLEISQDIKKLSENIALFASENPTHTEAIAP